MSFQPTGPSSETPDPPRKHQFLRWMGGCLIALGMFSLLVAMFAWPMAWGFAGLETHGFASYYFQPGGSNAEIILCPVEKHITTASLMFLTGALVLGLGILLWLVRFRLKLLILAVLAAGFAGAFPFLSIQFSPPPTRAALMARFEGPTKLKRAKVIRERLAFERLGEYRWKPEISFAPPTPLELTKLHYDLSVDDWCVDVHDTFMGIPFPRRPEIFECLLIFFEERLSVIAKEAGYAPLHARDRHVEWRLIER